MRSLFNTVLTTTAAISALGGTALAEPPEWAGEPEVELTLATQPGQMRYAESELTVTPGAKVKLTFDNPDDLQHNVIFLRADDQDLAGMAFALSAWEMGEKGIELGWVPEDRSRVIVASSLLDPQAKEELYFVAPDQPGEYPFVCTVPGHAQLMNGKLIVGGGAVAGALLAGLEFQLYEVSLNALPVDFSDLEPATGGEVGSELLSLKVRDKRNDNFAIVFTGAFVAPADGEYEFELESDDGSRLSVNGELICNNDGIHGMGNTKRGKVTLEEGEHDFLLEYFEKTGGEELVVGVNVPGVGLVPLSEQQRGRGNKKPPPTPIEIAATDGEAVIYRNFIAGALPRGIAVGYPEQVNLCWDADCLNLALLWRGSFMDASRHWSGRGQGSQPPMGYDVAKPAHGLPLQVMGDPEEPWVDFSQDTVAINRDAPPTDKTVTYNAPHPDYDFGGYRLDENRYPTFFYTFQGIEVTDLFTPADELRTGFTRTLSFEGKGPEGGTLYYRAQNGDPGSGLQVEVGGAEARQRGGETLVPIDLSSGEATITLTYRWEH